LISEKVDIAFSLHEIKRPAEDGCADLDLTWQAHTDGM